MIYKKLAITLSKISSIKQSLKILELKVPTTKTQIKKKYLLLARKYHPDSTDVHQSEKGGKQSKDNHKSQSDNQAKHKFINISKAYQYLREIQQQDINSNKQTTDADKPNFQERPEQRKSRMTTQQKKRKQTYEYFNKKFHDAVKSSSDGNNNQIEKKPFHKLLPELFIGLLILTAFLGDWTYRVLKKKYTTEDFNNGLQYSIKNEEQHIGSAFKTMNHNRRFNNVIKEQVIQ